MPWIIVTARIRRMREGNSFSLCVSSHLDRGGTPFSWQGGGYPFQRLDGGGTPFSGLGMGGTPSSWCGVPFPGLDGGGTPSWGVPHLGRAYPLAGEPPPPRQTSTACTCYAAGGVPLAFTQEDFLVLFNFTQLLHNSCDLLVILQLLNHG